MLSRRLLEWPRGCWPNESQRLLLQACFLEDDRACLRAYEAWQRLVLWDFIDGSSLRMLLLLKDRLRRMALSAPEMPRLTGIVRYHWVQTQLLQRDTISLLRLFNEAGLDTLLLKGAALHATVYPEGLRSMADIDVAVRRSQVNAALELLKRHAWEPRFRCHEQMPQVSHATHLTGKDHSDLDLHWDIFHEHYLTDEQLETIWQASHPIQVGAQPTRVLCPADQLLHTCEHGLRYDETPPFRWLADAYYLVRTLGEEIDWERCGWLAKQHGLLLPVRQTLDYLQQYLDLEIPTAARTQLQKYRVSLRSRWDQRIVSRRQPGIHPFLQGLPKNLLAYGRLRRKRPGIGLGSFLCQVNDLEMSPTKCLLHFAKLSAAASRSRCHDRVESLYQRISGRSRYLFSMASATADQLEGC